MPLARRVRKGQLWSLAPAETGPPRKRVHVEQRRIERHGAAGRSRRAARRPRHQRCERQFDRPRGPATYRDRVTTLADQRTSRQRSICLKPAASTRLRSAYLRCLIDAAMSLASAAKSARLKGRRLRIRGRGAIPDGARSTRGGLRFCFIGAPPTN